MALTALQPGDLHRPASLEPETVAGRPQRTAWPATKSSSLTNGWSNLLGDHPVVCWISSVYFRVAAPDVGGGPQFLISSMRVV
jgi:hypothetical protein